MLLGRSPFRTVETKDVPAVEFRRVSRRFEDVTALAEASSRIQKGEFFSLLGPSGCGKTTLLRIIAGLDWPDEGSVWIDGVEMVETPAYQRPVNTVFQSYALFPHLNVRENIAFGLRMKKVPQKSLADRVTRVMETVQISELAHRKPTQLSGGQRQRVALARAIVNEPKVLLLDEPLGALDLKLRKQLQIELHALQRRLGITFIYVTHDQDEALVMSDRIALMHQGKLIQTGTPKDIYEYPRTRFAAQFLGSCNLLDGMVSQADRDRCHVETRVGTVCVNLPSLRVNMKTGDKCTLAIRPENVELSTKVGAEQANAFPAVIADRVYTGAKTQLRLRIQGEEFHSSILNSHSSRLLPEDGQPIQACFPAESMVILDD